MKYLGDYSSDFKMTFKVVFQVGIIRNSDLLNSRGNFELTNKQFDDQYLPQSFINHCKLHSSRGSCEIPGITLRFAKGYLSDTSYFKVPIPFLPGTYLYEQMLLEMAFNFDFLSIGTEGEYCNEGGCQLWLQR